MSIYYHKINKCLKLYSCCLKPYYVKGTLEEKITKKRITTEHTETVACLAKLNISSNAVLQLLIKSLGPEVRGTTLFTFH